MRTKLLAFVIFAALPCFGQTFGEITGVVTDPAGALVVGAAVTVSNPATNLTRTATTNNAGNYTFPSLLPGVYSVKAEMPGFQGEIRGGVELQVQPGGPYRLPAQSRIADGDRGGHRWRSAAQ